MANKKAANCCGIFIRIILVFLNLFYLLAGLSITALGIYLIIDTEKISTIVGNNLLTGTIIIVVFGALTILTAVLGIIGAVAALWPVLIVYCVFVFGLLGLQVAGGVFVYLNRDKIVGKVRNQLTEYFKNYTYNTSSPSYNEYSNKIIDTIQSKLRCCGGTGYIDWVFLHPEIRQDPSSFPNSCKCHANTSDCQFVVTTLHVWKRGCNESFFDFISHNVAVLEGVAGVIGFIQILTIVLTIVLIIVIILLKHCQSRDVQIQNAAYTPLDTFPANDYYKIDNEYVQAPDRFAF